MSSEPRREQIETADSETILASSARVLLLEAGGWDRDPWLTIPLARGRILQRRMHDRMYFAEPETTLDGRGIECARGKVIGGSSSINAMAYVRGHRGDYDRWAEAGLPHCALNSTDVGSHFSLYNCASCVTITLSPAKNTYEELLLLLSALGLSALARAC